MNRNVLLLGASSLVILFGLWRVGSSLFAGPDVGPSEGYRALNIETGHRFHVKIDEDFAGWPVEAPDTGQRTGYPAEECDCGNWVVLNQSLGKPEITTCSQCNKPVAGRRMPQAAVEAAPEEAPKGKKSKRRRGRGGR